MSDVTVVIPVYNVELYLKKCVESVLAQSYNDYTIILVDDGSTDTSGRICDDYAEKNENIQVIHQQNKGLGGARNTGIEACQTQYILFLDSDDYLHPDTLRICMNLAKANGCDMVFYDMIAVNEQGDYGAGYFLSLPQGQLLTEKEVPMMLSVSGACNRLFRTDLFTAHGIRFPEKVWYEDLKTVPKLVAYVKKAWYYHEQPLYYYLQREGSIMHAKDFDRVVRERIEAVEEIYSFYRSRELLEVFHEELSFLRLYHGYFLPVRELQAASKDFAPYADALLDDLLNNCKAPLQNPYLSEMSIKEQKMLKLFISRKYGMVRCLSVINKFLKGVKNVFKAKKNLH